MPIYEYNCGKCGNQFEVLIRTKSDLPSKCPKCGAKDPKKAFSTFAVSASQSRDSMCDTCPSADDGGCASGVCPMSGR